MANDKTKPESRQYWRVILMASAAVVVGLGAVAGFAYETHFGGRVFHALGINTTNKNEHQSKLARLMDKGRQALAQNHPRLAIIFLKNAVSVAPKDGDVRLQLGVALLQAGDLVSAERELRSARQFGASDKKVLPVLFTVMIRRSEGRQLLAQFPGPAKGDTSALASETLRARAVAFTQTGEPKKAAAALDRALSFDKSAANLVARAHVARSMGNTDLAMNLLHEALSKFPKDVSALMTEVDLLMQTKQDDKALAAANDLVKYYPKSPAALMARAGVYLQMHQHEKAMADIDASLKAVPHMTLGVYYKALALEQAKHVKRAWNLAQGLPPAFINSRPGIGAAVSQMATNAGNEELGASILSSTVSHFPKDVDARVLLAAHYLKLRDGKHALETLQPMANSSDPRIMVLLSQAYNMQHQYAKAIEYLEKVSATGVGGDRLKQQIALTNLQAGNLDTAIKELERLNAANPGDPQTAGSLIGALMHNNDYANALNVAENLASAAPKSPYGPLYQGQLLLRRGDLDGAVSSFSRAIERDKKFIPAIYERAVALAARGDLQAADTDLRSILSTDPRNMMVQIKLAQVALQAGEKDKAAALLKQAVTAHPKELLPTLVLLRLDIQQGHLDQAAAVIANFLSKVPNNPRALAMQAEIQLMAGKADQSVTTFRQLANTYPKSPQIKMLLASALAKSGNAKDAMSAYQDAVQLAPNLQATQLALIRFALANKNDRVALSAARGYSEKQPGPASANTLARTYATLNRISDAVNVLTQSQAKYPNRGTLILLSGLLRKQGEIQKADTMLTDWIAKHPDDVAVRMVYAGAQLIVSPTTAETQYHAVLKLQPYNAAALNNLGWLLQKKDPKAALTYCERAAKLAPNSASVLDTLGWTRWLLNDKKSALSLLKRAHDSDPKNGDITYHLVVALDGNGQHADAKKTLAELLASNQDFNDKAAAKALQAKWR